MVEETRKYETDPETIFERLKKRSRETEFNVDKIDEDNGRLMLSTGISLLSYGEKVEVIVSREKEGGSWVYVSSTPKAWFNITAEGNTKRNIQRIFDILEKQT